MIANYHTHTARCHHASGTLREYVEAAVSAGMTTLGFSDHAPQFFDSGYVSRIRMTPSEAPEYVRSIRKLAEEYQNDIRICVGFEAEYWPDTFGRLRQYCRELGVDYLILGQHFYNREEDGFHFGTRFDDPAMLTNYVDRVLEGLATGCFSCLAHPDLPNFTGDPAWYNAEMTRLCTETRKMHIPLEVNMLGFADHRQYPCQRFFDIVKSVGNETVLGCDAHTPAALADVAEQDALLAFANRLGLSPLSEIPLKKV